jgi:hypothetical protein
MGQTEILKFLYEKYSENPNQIFSAKEISLALNVDKDLTHVHLRQLCKYKFIEYRILSKFGIFTSGPWPRGYTLTQNSICTIKAMIEAEENLREWKTKLIIEC